MDNTPATISLTTDMENLTLDTSPKHTFDSSPKNMQHFMDDDIIENLDYENDK